MDEQLSHEEELLELYQKLSVEIPGIYSGRAISFEALKVIVDKMMNKAFYYGTRQGIQTVEDVMEKVFK